VSTSFPDAPAMATSVAGPGPGIDAHLGRLGHALRGPRRGFDLRIRRGTLGLTLLAVILGVYLAAQWQSRPRPASAAPEYRREVAAQTIERLEAEQADLKRQIADLRAQLGARQAAAAGQPDLAELSAELDEAKLLAGTVAVHGPGIRVLLDDSAVRTIPPKDDPAMYIVHDYQLRDVVNALWAAGAEAISINGERIVAPTSIYCVGSTILVNDTRTSPAYEFLVIGDPAKLDAALADSANLRALKGRVKSYGLQFSTQKLKDVSVPAYAGGLDVRHALGVDAPSTRGGTR
jgi:uncharacterized protein YlxW (UPF0749 family)